MNDWIALQKDYWCGSSSLAQDVTLTGAERTLQNAEFVEEEPIGLKAGVQIKGLSKEYRKVGRLPRCVNCKLSDCN